MSKDIDEGLIEATIRRVQAQTSSSGEPAATADDAVDDDPIEATIRRVQEQAASSSLDERADDVSHGDVAKEEGGVAEEDPIEAAIRRVQAQAQAHETGDVPVNAEIPSPDSDGAVDAIEATIRRVRQQAAEHAQTESPAEPAELPDDDDPIAATVRRVKAQAAAREQQLSAHEPEDDPQSEDAIAATIRRVQEQAAHRDEVVAETGASDSDGLTDDDPIAATIRRVQQQAHARHEESSAFAPAPLPPMDDEFDEDVVEQAIHFAEQDRAGHEGEDVIKKEPLETTTWPGRDDRLLGDPQSWEVAARRLEQGMQETNQELRALAARFDALLPALERFVQSGAAPAGLSVVQPASPTEDEWDDSPRVAAMDFGTPPRPPVLRDPAPQGAVAHQLVEEPAAAGPRLRALDEHGNLNEHLPRQYRITVEDKRRGVDLVPLHRAMQSLHNVKDMSLLSYNNGVAIVSVESVGVIDPDGLGAAVSRCMSRETKVEVHNEQTMVVKIQEE